MAVTIWRARACAGCATIVPCLPTTWKTSDAAPPRPTAPRSNASSNRAASPAASAAQADLVILNTCTVTNSADQDARAAIRRVQRTESAGKNYRHGMLRPARSRRNCSAARRDGCDRQLAQTSTRGNRVAEYRSRRTAIRGRTPGRFFRISTLLGAESQISENWISVSDIFAHTELWPLPSSSLQITSPAALAPTSKCRTDATIAALSA